MEYDAHSRPTSLGRNSSSDGPKRKPPPCPSHCGILQQDPIFTSCREAATECGEVREPPSFVPIYRVCLHIDVARTKSTSKAATIIPDTIANGIARACKGQDFEFFSLSLHKCD